MSSDHKTPGTEPEPGIRVGKDGGPEGAYKPGKDGVADDDRSAEGHGIRWKATDDVAGPNEATRAGKDAGPEGGRSYGKDGVADDEPGPEETARVKF